MNRKYFLWAMPALILLGTLGQTSVKAQENKQVIKALRTEKEIESVPLDTLSITPAIDAKYVWHPEQPENPMAAPKVGRANNLRPGQVRNVRRGKKQGLFPAIGATGWTPPDCTLAVGPNHIVATLNSSIAFFDKAGTKQFQQTSSTFFAGLGAGTFQFDPKCFYDRIHQRFVLIMDEEDTPSKTSKILLAVSDDSDPNGTWYRYRLEAKITQGTTSYWLDYPGLGYNKDAYVISGNMFGFSSGFGGAQFIVVPSAAILTGGAASATSLLDASGGSVQVCEMIDPSASNIFGVSDYTTTSFRLYSLGNLTASPTMTFASVTVPSFSTPSRAANSTGGKTLDSLDGRVFNASWRNGKLVTAHCIQNGNLRARWYEFNTNSWPTSGSPSLNQSGEISGGDDYHMPAINRNAAGDIALIFSRSSTSITADIMYAARAASDPLGTLGTPTLLESSAGSNYGDGRWGDYFKVDVDPVDDNTFWGIAMDVASNNAWKTSIFSWTVTSVPSVPAAPTGLTATAGNAQVSLTWSASAGATSYNIYQGTTTGTETLLQSGVTTTNFTNTGLTNGTTYYYKVSAVNAVGESSLSTEASATPVVSTSQQLLVNPGFETGTAAPWIVTAGVLDNTAGEPAHNGSWKAWLNGYGSVHTDTLAQTVSIPASAKTVTLSFWIHIDTKETTTTKKNDTLTVQLKNTAGATLLNVASFSNLNKNTGYVKKSFNLINYRGKTVQLYVVGKENSSLATNFVMDDFAIDVK